MNSLAFEQTDRANFSSALVRAGLQLASNFEFRLTIMDKKKLPAGIRERLLRAAQKATKNAYAPFSNFHVGAAILTAKGDIFLGCNVENSSYGMTNCAERTAICSAVAEKGPKLEIVAVAVTNAQGVPCSPCGACRQVIYEFGPDAIIFYQGKRGPAQSHITELLPEGFRLERAK